MADDIRLENTIIRGLACAALHPGLRTILLLDAAPEQVTWCSRLLEKMVAVSTGGVTVPPIMLTTSTSEDALWGVPSLSSVQGKPYFVSPPLLSDHDAGISQLLTIPDLTRLSLAAERAIVMAADAVVLHLERHGQQRHWQPQIWWVAGCAEADLGQVSPHLLDRFLLRLRVRTPEHEDEPGRIDYLLAQFVPHPTEPNELSLPDKVIKALKQALLHNPELSKAAQNEVLRYVVRSRSYSVRRDLALIRVAVACAMLDEHVQVTHIHVRQAAGIMGYKPIAMPEFKPESEHKPSSDIPDRPPDEPSLVDDDSDEGSTDDGKGKGGFAPLTPPDATHTGTATPLPAALGNPYPEDSAPTQREVASLQLPLRQRGHDLARRGPAIGIEPATDLHDLALVGTMFAALKYQSLRRRLSPEMSGRLILRSTDLRRYRRLPTPEVLLVLVIDYTALRHCDWEAALLPHLGWAYVSRASIALIRVGASDAANELCAERIQGRSLLDPRIGNALAAKAGRATPLAHGLELALKTLRHALQHGRTAVVQARLVVLSDGRGNVPLSASHASSITMPVNREGIDDALRVAIELNQIRQTEIVCLDPQPFQCAELSQALAAALGVVSEPIAALNLAKREKR